MDTQELRDISGIGDVSAWPPAPGWFVLIGVIMALVAGVALYKRVSHKRRIASSSLYVMPDPHMSNGERAALLAENIRRVMLARFPREDVAGVFGIAWLTMLEDKDPSGHAWTRYAKWLPDAAYVPEKAGDAVPADELTAAERACRDLASARFHI